MGAFSWKWVAPFGPDALKILQEAREQAFRERAYGKPYERGQPRSRTLQALEKATAEDGTCSIIDVHDIGDAPGCGVAGPFPRMVLQNALGTVKPTLAEAEERLSRLYEHLSRGQAAYVVCYRDGKPHEVLFLGYSYD